MTGKGVVVKTDFKIATVRIRKSSACGHDCGECRACGGAEFLATVTNSVGAKVGDTVIIGAPSGKVLAYSFLLYILPILGGEYMQNLTTSKLNDFIHHKLNNGRLNGNGGLSAKSVRDIMTVYRSIESYAAREYGIKETHFTMPKIEKKQTDVLSTFERKRLENYLIHNQNNTNISVLLCLFTGLRVGELCGLKWGDIDFKNETVSVQRTVQRVNKHGKSEIVIGSPKSKSSNRTIPIPNFLLAILKTKRKGDDFYIITGTCKPTEPRTMQNRFKAILKICGIRNVNFHLLRHTYATVCIESGFDPKTLSELLGHADANITLNQYVHSSMQMKKNYVSRLKLTA